MGGDFMEDNRVFGSPATAHNFPTLRKPVLQGFAAMHLDGGDPFLSASVRRPVYV
jgi:hypothetical protein